MNVWAWLAAHDERAQPLTTVHCLACTAHRDTVHVVTKHRSCAQVEPHAPGRH